MISDPLQPKDTALIHVDKQPTLDPVDVRIVTASHDIDVNLLHPMPRPTPQSGINKV